MEALVDHGTGSMCPSAVLTGKPSVSGQTVGTLPFCSGCSALLFRWEGFEEGVLESDSFSSSSSIIRPFSTGAGAGATASSEGKDVLWIHL